MNRVDDKQAMGKSPFDVIKWLFAIALLVGGIVANSYYSQIAWALRAAGAIVLAAVIVAIVLQTSKGRGAWSFIKGSRTELRKVVWPTRQETIQTTLIVLVVVVVTALILWAFDSLFLWLITWLTS